jgi:hypothetical protein
MNRKSQSSEPFCPALTLAVTMTALGVSLGACKSKSDVTSPATSAGADYLKVAPGAAQQGKLAPGAAEQVKLAPGAVQQDKDRLAPGAAEQGKIAPR